MDEGGCAFPGPGEPEHEVRCKCGYCYEAGPEHGMTLRDWFAGLALSCLEDGPKGIVARDAYKIADAMIVERKE